MEQFVPLFEEFVEINEKWKDAAEIEDTGEYAGKTIDELAAMKKKLMDKEERSEAEQTKVRQINFAIRAKRGFKGGAK